MSLSTGLVVVFIHLLYWCQTSSIVRDMALSACSFLFYSSPRISPSIFNRMRLNEDVLSTISSRTCSVYLDAGICRTEIVDNRCSSEDVCLFYYIERRQMAIRRESSAPYTIIIDQAGLCQQAYPCFHHEDSDIVGQSLYRTPTARSRTSGSNG